ncbi:hypothetical protein [Flammeovirga kamogawensis]|uniref:DUF4149 domain-containing protein n=1 Tax=Flammeovirga kamogawensis TaxID=373891 RepID=A0ABX8H0E8_9BACT|nr:hypothetical protein [Flammeovirga kamogawensis]MBB6462299.1 hypothetical protein [Flammeovirga kamogawensis]QWG09311.1 hypothetical protein KM029_22150 [Flammeovirga kamogawensis]TRX64833.1 hypothetical protein EO216_20060 [Flammeovirga kamogawensis]
MKNINIALIYLWIGFVCAISFMEAWLKFQAPGVTLKIGLGIGTLVFSALNGVEICFAVMLFADTSYRHIKFPSVVVCRREYLYLSLPIFILLIQSVWILPELTIRAEKIINNIAVAPSYIHAVYGALEVIKVLTLFQLGRLYLKKTDTK